MPEMLKVTLNLIILGTPLVLGLLAVRNLILVFRRDEDRGRRALLVKRAGLGIMGAFGFVVAAFAIGEPLADPGGWLGVGMVASWLVPLAGIGFLIRLKPSVAQVMLIVLTAAAVSLAVWGIFDENLRNLEDRNGPFTLVPLLAVAIAAAGLGYYRPTPAAMMLMACALVPPAASVFSPVEAGPGTELYAIVGLPMLVTAVLYLVSDRISGGVLGTRISRNTHLGRPRSA